MTLQPFNHFLAQTAPPENDIYDIVVLAPKDPLWPTIIWSLTGLLILGVLGYFLYRLLSPGKGKRPANLEAIAMQRLRTAQAQQEEVSPNAYTLALSEALKDYLSEKFKDPVRFETTQEFLGRISAAQSRLPVAAQQHLESFLVRADEVKFGNSSDGEKKAAPLGKIAEQVVQLCQVVNDQDSPGG